MSHRVTPLGVAAMCGALLWGVSPPGADAAGNPEPLAFEQAAGYEVSITGTLAVYGSEPHTFPGLLALPEGNGNVATRKTVRIPIEQETVIRLEFDGMESLLGLQGARVRVTGKITRNALGPGMPAILAVESIRVLR